jgi:hypothetical protein
MGLGDERSAQNGVSLWISLLSFNCLAPCFLLFVFKKSKALKSLKASSNVKGEVGIFFQFGKQCWGKRISPLTLLLRGILLGFRV